MSQLTKEQLGILQHALGVDEYGQTPKELTDYHISDSHRNYFCADGSDVAICKSLADLGYMVQRDVSWVPRALFFVTDSGKQAMREQSPKPPKLTRSQRRYREFRSADTGCTFREWIGVR